MPQIIKNGRRLLGCFYNGAVLVNGQSIPDPGNLCSECTCQVPRKHSPEVSLRSFSSVNTSFHLLQSGSVRCSRTSCPPPLCSHPATNACGCSVCDGKRPPPPPLSAEILKSQEISHLSPVCVGCHYRGLTYGDGQIFPGQDGCQDCTCSVRGRSASFV